MEVKLKAKNMEKAEDALYLFDNAILSLFAYGTWKFHKRYKLIDSFERRTKIGDFAGFYILDDYQLTRFILSYYSERPFATRIFVFNKGEEKEADELWEKVRKRIIY